jgi:urease accessory protein
MLATQVTDNSYKGWQASLALQFCHTPEKTLLHSAHHVGPLTVQRPFYPEGETCHLYLLHPPGGIVGGDTLDISVRLDAKSHTLITMPGASKFYRSSGPQACLNQHFYLDEEATLEWLPQDTIIFPGANAALRSVFHLKASSTLLAWELYCLGRPVINETFSHGTLESRLEVWVDDEPRLIERQHLSDGDLAPLPGIRGSAHCCSIPPRKIILRRYANGSRRWIPLPARRSPTVCCRCVFSPR